MKSLNFEQIGRNCFNPALAVKFPYHKLEMWPGFDVRLVTKEAGIFLNIEPCYRVIRFDTAIETINKIVALSD